MRYSKYYKENNNLYEMIERESLLEDSEERRTARFYDYWDGRTDNEFIRWLGNQHDPKVVPRRARILIPKWPLLHPNKYDKYWSANRMEIEQEEDGYYELIPFRQLTQQEGNDKFNYILLNAGDMLIPIRLYSRGGVEVDPAYRTEFNRRFSNEERHFILGCIIHSYLDTDLHVNYDDYVGWAQRRVSGYRPYMSPKRLRTGDIRLYDSKTRRKIKSESCEITINTNESNQCLFEVNNNSNRKLIINII